MTYLKQRKKMISTITEDIEDYYNSEEEDENEMLS